MTTEKLLVSIVVPTHNDGPTLLRAAVNSALAQTHSNVEVIVVNDASTDNTLSGLDGLDDPRLRVINLPENGGPSPARNEGTRAARGEWICYLDADDLMLPSLIGRLLEITRQTGADIACCSYQRGEPGKAPKTVLGQSAAKVNTPLPAIAETLYQTGSLDNSPWGKLYRRELCLSQPWLSGRFEDLRTFYRIFERARLIAWTDEPLYVYTINPSSYMQQFSPGRAVVLDVVEEMVDYMASNRPTLLPAARDRALSAAFNILKLMRENNTKMPEVAARCKAIIRRYRRQSLLNPRVRLKNKAAILATYLGGLHLL